MKRIVLLSFFASNILFSCSTVKNNLKIPVNSFERKLGKILKKKNITSLTDFVCNHFAYSENSNIQLNHQFEPIRTKEDLQYILPQLLNEHIHDKWLYTEHMYNGFHTIYLCNDSHSFSVHLHIRKKMKQAFIISMEFNSISIPANEQLVLDR